MGIKKETTNVWFFLMRSHLRIANDYPRNLIHFVLYTADTQYDEILRSICRCEEDGWGSVFFFLSVYVYKKKVAGDIKRMKEKEL
jgi:hypothetical protein